MAPKLSEAEKQIRKQMVDEYNEYLKALGREQLAREKPTLAQALFPRGGPKLLSDAERGCISPLGNLAQPTKGTSR